MKIFFLASLLIFTHANSYAQRRGLTWGVMPQEQPSGYVNVNCHGKPGTESGGYAPSCDAYNGDTPCEEIRPVLCINKNGAEKPANITTDQYNQWAAGEVRLTDPIEGNKLTSEQSANAYCAEYFGPGWRMAEHHDAWGWGFWAMGSISKASRFWVHIKNQNANCWNGGPPPTNGPSTPVTPIGPNTNIPSFLF